MLHANSDRIEYVEVLDRDNPEEPVHYRAATFVVAAGYCWSPHLLLLSANSRYPDGVANRSGHVGKYMTGHRGIVRQVEVPGKLFPGVYFNDSLVSKRFQVRENEKYIRHDMRIWESDFDRRARLKDVDGKLMLALKVIHHTQSPVRGCPTRSIGRCLHLQIAFEALLGLCETSHALEVVIGG